MSVELIPSYLGQVATRARIAVAFNAGATRQMSRTQHIARDAISNLRLVIPNWYVPGQATGEANPGAAATLKASVEYPAGTFTQVLFGAAATYVAPNGETSVSDAVTVAIPRGELFWVRIYRECAAGIIYSGGGSPADTLEFGGAEITDKTMSGSVANAGGGNSFYPVAIIAQTRRPSAILFGDSNTEGAGETDPDNTNDRGILARSVGPLGGYIDCGRGSDTIQGFRGANAKRLALQQYASHIFFALGRNDQALGVRTATQIMDDITAVAATFSRPAYCVTIPPTTTSSDSFATVANQTVQNPETSRLQVNRWMRAVPRYFIGCIDIATALESSFESGKWVTPPGGATGAAVASTADGVHPNSVGHRRIRDARLITPGHLARGLTAV